MSSTFTSRLKLERQASGANSGNWGNLVNYVLNRIDSTVRGYVAVNVAGSANVTLVSNNSTNNTAESADDQVHNKVIEFTGALGAPIHVFTDAVEGDYTIFNNTTGSHALTFANTGHAANGVAITQGTKSIVYTNGSTIYDVGADLGSIKVSSLTSNGGATITGNTDVTGNIALKTQKAMVFEDSSGGQFAALKAAATTTSYTLTLPAATGSADQVMKTDGSGNLSFVDQGGGSVSWNTTPITANTTATAGVGFFGNTSGGAFILTLPSSPSAGDIVAVKDYANTFDTNALTIARNGEKIQGGTTDMTLNTEGLAITLFYVDSTKGWMQINDSTSDNFAQYITATGGTITSTPTCKIHTFTSPGTFAVSNAGNPSGSNELSYMVVAGGGGSASANPGDASGGGGAGGFREGKSSQTCYTASPAAGSAITAAVQSYTVTIGAGQPGPTNGSDSVFGSITSSGGGSGRLSGAGIAGGSGGGGGNGSNANGGAGNTPPVSPSQGFAGGDGLEVNHAPANYYGGGGGGGSAVGVDSTPSGSGAGGAGHGTGINPAPGVGEPGPSGSLRYFAGGGGGSLSPPRPTNNPAAGGVGGGGDQGADGAANTGGGAGGQIGTDRVGGSGIVIIRYKIA